VSVRERRNRKDSRGKTGEQLRRALPWIYDPQVPVPPEHEVPPGLLLPRLGRSTGHSPGIGHWHRDQGDPPDLRRPG
jgi:hypothetical protein